ncbi:MAG TPA: UDP-N-acetylmuramoyl-L-alanyl-D-glutamate--2,6-diaminopimelate ligase [Bacillales bacterium]|nr:UDP-N-acetylmuramoyl-L-alanyl-D-glutamate--2,6-diaminopimelate ligase [Bacillales bacterium]
MQLKSLLDHLLICRGSFSDNPDITSVETDSRNVTDGSLFICIRGHTVDGHDFADEAVQSGAAAIVSEQPLKVPVPTAVVPDSKRAVAVLADAFYGRPTKQLRLIGVTGTNGKTTTTHLIQAIFAGNGEKTGLIGTVGMKIAGESAGLRSATPTTPEAVVLQKAFAKMVKENVDMAVMEVSSHALDMGRVWGSDFDIAVFTNLSQDHLEYHPTMEHYFQAKSLLFSQLGNTYDRNGRKAAVINADDARAEDLKRVTAVQILTYGIKNHADVRAQQIELSEKGTRFLLATPFGSREITMPLIGLFNVYNALAAASSALLSGISLDRVKESLESVSGVPGRFEVVGEGHPFTVIVDYAHTPDSLENVLSTVRQFARGRVFAVVGCGGDRDHTKRPLMAQVAVKYSDVAVFTSDNPRNEDPLAIIRDMEKGVNGEAFVSIPDRSEAIHYAVGEASDGDIIVIAGKGHETYQIIGGDVIDFDDREVARQAIMRRSGSK